MEQDEAGLAVVALELVIILIVKVMDVCKYRQCCSGTQRDRAASVEAESCGY